MLDFGLSSLAKENFRVFFGFMGTQETLKSFAIDSPRMLFCDFPNVILKTAEWVEKAFSSVASLDPRVNRLILFIMSIITNTAGIGGGTVLAPLFFIFFGFIGSEAAFLSKSTIFAGAFANLLFIAMKKDPKNPKKLLVDYKLASILLPSCLIGTSIGVPVSNFLPNGLVFTMQACILSTLIFRVHRQTRRPSQDGFPCSLSSFRAEVLGVKLFCDWLTISKNKNVCTTRFELARVAPSEP